MNEEQLQIMSRSWSQQTQAIEQEEEEEEEDLARGVQLQAPTSRILSRCRRTSGKGDRGGEGGFRGYGNIESCGKLRVGNFWRVVSTLARALTDARDQLVGIMSDSPSTSGSTRYRYGDGRRRNTQFSPSPSPSFSSYPKSAAAAGFAAHHPREKHHIQGYAAYHRSPGCGLRNPLPLRRRRRCTPPSPSCRPSCWHSITPRTTPRHYCCSSPVTPTRQQRTYKSPTTRVLRRRSSCAGGGGGGMHVGIEFTRGGGCDGGTAATGPVNICLSSGSAASSRAADCRHSSCHNNPCLDPRPSSPKSSKNRHCMGANYAELLRKEACRLRKHRIAQTRCCRRQFDEINDCCA